MAFKGRSNIRGAFMTEAAQAFERDAGKRIVPIFRGQAQGLALIFDRLTERLIEG